MHQRPLFEDLPVKRDRIKAQPDRSPLTYITRRQQLWGLRQGLRLQGSAVDRGEPLYCPSLADNLFLGGLTPQSRREYEAADGHELASKMRALHSSSAAVVNLFDYWRSLEDFDPALRALKLPTKPRSVSFEAKLPISSRFSTCPNIDLLVTYPGAPAVVLESKFSEPFGREHTGFAAKYFAVPGVWTGLPNLRNLAEQIEGDADPSFGYLHASQLIKHTLGATVSFGPRNFVLVYFFLAAHGEAGGEHEREIAHFANILKRDGVAFRAVSHQAYILRLAAAERGRHRAFIDWMCERYL
jgi:hypothetical protein